MSILKILSSLFLFLPCFSISQTDTTERKTDISFSGFLDTYYSYDLNNPNQVRQNFFFNHNRHNNININLALLRLQARHEKYRANIGLHTGTYVTDNYAAEPLANKLLYEANAGVSLTKNNKLWLDAGVFESYIGFESAISSLNATLTRSLAAESSPYFLTGAKLSWTEDKWNIGVYLLNGWQRIQMVQGNNLSSFGTQFSYSMNDHVTLNWNTFIGTEDPDSTRRMRYFSNFYTTAEWGKFNFIAGFDFGIQQEIKGSSTYYNWFNSSLIGQYQFHEKWATTLRAEYFNDPEELIITTPLNSGFETMAFSLNLDYQPHQKITLGAEGRMLTSSEDIFVEENGLTSNNLFFTVSIAALLD